MIPTRFVVSVLPLGTGSHSLMRCCMQELSPGFHLILLLLFVHTVIVPLLCCHFGKAEQCFPSSCPFTSWEDQAEARHISSIPPSPRSLEPSPFVDSFPKSHSQSCLTLLMEMVLYSAGSFCSFFSLYPTFEDLTLGA